MDLVTPFGWIVRPFLAVLPEWVGSRFVLDLEPDRERAEKTKRPQRLTLPWQQTVGAEVSSLLDWRSRLVPQLYGREDELDELDRWAWDGTGPRVRLVIGEGGTGKTRLGAELVERLGGGWKAGFAALDEPLRFHRGRHGTLLLVDYPEERLERVRSLLSKVGRRDRNDLARIRILLLTRRDESYWRDRLDGSARALFDPWSLPLGVPSVEELHEIFSVAEKEVADRKGLRRPRALDRERFSAWVDRQPEHRRPLFVIAAAAARVLEPDRDVLEITAGEVLQVLVRRERGQLESLSEKSGLGPKALSRLYALSAVAGELDREDLRRLAARKERLDLDLEKERVLAGLERSGHLGRHGTATLPALRPDLFAAAFFHDVMQESGEPSEWLWAALEFHLPESADRLGRLLYDCESVLGLTAPRPSAWLETAVAVDLYRKLAEDRPDAFRPALATSLSVLGNCYEANQQGEAARTAVQEAFQLLLPYYRQHPAAHESLMQAILEDYERRAAAVGMELDAEVLEVRQELGAAQEATEAASEPE